MIKGSCMILMVRLSLNLLAKTGPEVTAETGKKRYSEANNKVYDTFVLNKC